MKNRLFAFALVFSLIVFPVHTDETKMKVNEDIPNTWSITDVNNMI